MGDLNFCSQLPTATIGNTGITWAQADLNALSNLTSPPSVSYLRPDSAGALLPWIYTLVILVVHIPVVLIRVVRWQAIQHWCLVSALFTIVVCIQAYISTEFQAAKVLVWTPLLLVIDAGSMLQVFFLIIEAKKDSFGNQVQRCTHCPSQYTLSKAISQDSFNLLGHYSACREHTAVIQRPLAYDIRCERIRSNEKIPPRTRSSSGVTSSASENLRWYRNRFNYTAVIAAILFVTVVVLQLLGLVKAAQAAKASSDPLLVPWCSPLFQPFGIAAVDGSCNIYHVSQSAHTGIGCIMLPGQWQQQWLKGTIAGISIELFTEVVDLLILSLVNGKRKIFEAVKLKRPWATMFSGLIVLIVTLIYGINYSLYLPPGVTERIVVLMDAQGPASYSGKLTSAGLRGTIIGWSDGLFQSWQEVYLGG